MDREKLNARPRPKIKQPVTFLPIFMDANRTFVRLSYNYVTELRRYETNKDSDTIQLIFMFIFVVGFTIFGKYRT